MPARPPIPQRRRPLLGPFVLMISALVLALSGCHGTPSDSGAASAPRPPIGSSPSAPSSPSASTASAPSSPPASRFRRYVALGDSYTAAPGVAGRQSSDGCQRSSGNYPHLLAATLHVSRLVDVSCSGADPGDVRHAQLRGVAPQLDAVTRDTDLVTIGLGGNDENLFMRLLTTCLRQNPAAAKGTPCTRSLGPAVAPALHTMQHDLVDVVSDVRRRAPSARILLVGYPQILSASTTCPDVPFAPGDYRFARQVNHGMTEAVRRAAEATRTTYVDAWKASAGHDICAAEPWINGLSGPGAAPFHPFAVEQAAVARLVAASLT